MDTEHQMADMIRDMAEAHVRLVKVGMDATEERFGPAIRALEREFYRSLTDPQTKMSTTLQVCIANVLALVKAE